MPIGDGLDATAAGMTVVLGTVLAKTIDQELTKGRDYTANGPAYWKPGVTCSIERGGTGSTTAAAARTALGITPRSIGAAEAGAAGLRFTSPGFNRLSFAADGVTAGTEIALMYHLDGKLDKTGGTLTGPLTLADAAPVNVNYAALYRNGDGRVGLTPSARKYKRDIEAYDGSVLEATPVTYVLDDDPTGTIRLGVIADDVDEIEPMLVIRGDDGRIESFRYELLAVALLRDVQRLHARLVEVETYLDELHAGLEAAQ